MGNRIRELLQQALAQVVRVARAGVKLLRGLGITQPSGHEARPVRIDDWADLRGTAPGGEAADGIVGLLTELLEGVMFALRLQSEPLMALHALLRSRVIRRA